MRISPEPAPELLTALAGLPLVAKTFRALRLPESVKRNSDIKKRARGFSESERVESLVLLNAAGGDCLDDLGRLQVDEGLVVADEFRDGNVPAMMEPLTVAQRAFAALPSTVEQYFYRADSASHEGALLRWLRDEDRAAGPKGPIGFAISARMSKELAAAIAALPPEA